MTNTALQLDLISAFGALSAIPLEYRDRGAALKRITDLGMQLMGSRACTLTRIDLDGRYLEFEALSGFDDDFAARAMERRIALGSTETGELLSWELFAQGKVTSLHNLHEQGQGVANPHTARRYDLKSIFSYPLKSDGRLLGYLNHFSSENRPFTKEEEKLLEIFAHQAVNTIEKFEHYQALDRSLGILKDLSQSLLLLSSDQFLQLVAEMARKLVHAPVAIVWRMDQAAGKLRVAACSGEVDSAYRRMELDLHGPGVERVLQKRSSYLTDAGRSPRYFEHVRQARERRWVSLLTAPMRADQELIGILDVYTTSPHKYPAWERSLFETFAEHAAFSIQKAELLNQRKTWQGERRILQVAPAGEGATELAETLDIIVEQCASIHPGSNCALHLWNENSASFVLRAYFGNDIPVERKRGIEKIALGQGAIGRAGQRGKPELIGDAEASRPERALGRSLLSLPIHANQSVLGVLTVGNEEPGMFSDADQKLLASILESVPIAIERASIMDGLTRRTRAMAKSDSIESILEETADTAREWMRDPIALIWILDKARNGLTLRMTRGAERALTDYARFFLDAGDPWVRSIMDTDAPVYSSLAVDPKIPEVIAREADMRSLAAIRLTWEEHPGGILVVGGRRPARTLTKRDGYLLRTLATQAGLDLKHHLRLTGQTELIRLMQELQDLQDRGPLLERALQGGIKLLGCDRGCVRLFDRKSGELTLARGVPRPKDPFPVPYGKGVTGKAVLEKELQYSGDLTQEPWASMYVDLWKTGGRSRSELAVPLIVSNAQIRVGTKVEAAPKVLGVINFESPSLHAFSRFERECASVLARHLARILERIEFDKKLQALQKVEREIVGKRDWESIIEIVLVEIEKTLGYEYVNISLAYPDENKIRTVYLHGIAEAEEFKRMAVHELDSNDIQAQVVKNKKPEVPAPDDGRFDPEMYKRFDHGELIRVFMPMIVSTDNAAIGTVEAGYARRHREHIYERDVQILRGFVEYATMALEQKRRGQIDRISHELNAPLAAVRGNASFLQRRWTELSPERIQRQCDDMVTDSEILLFQVKQLEYILGSGAPSSAVVTIQNEPILLFRDIIFKTISQLKPLVQERGLDTSRIQYESEDVHKVKPIYTDKGKLSQVFFNLFMNSLKYYETPETFEIRIGADETKEYYVICFRDWGIGIPEGLEERIFEDGYRAPVARRKNVSGSGFGLTIARRIMKQLGGDLRLAHNYKPTEFQILLPKRSRGGT